MACAIGRLFEAYRQNEMKVHDPLYIKSNNERIDKIKSHVTMFSTWQNYKNMQSIFVSLKH